MLGKGSALLHDAVAGRLQSSNNTLLPTQVRLGGMACLTYLRTPLFFLPFSPSPRRWLFRICESSYEHLSIGTGVKDPPNCHSRRAWRVNERAEADPRWCELSG